MNDYTSILIVDDEISEREIIKKLISSKPSSFKVVGEAANGLEAMDFINLFHPDIVITDIVMPSMNGIAFTEVLTQDYPEIPIVVLSSYSDFDYVRETLRHGAVDYILKPMLNQNILFTALHQAEKRILPKKKHSLSDSLRFSLKISEYILNDTLAEPDTELCAYLNYPGFAVLYTNGNYASNPQILADFMQKELPDFLHDHKTIFFHLTENQYALLLNYNGYTEDIIHIMQVRIQLFKKKEPDTFFILSNPFSCVKELRNAYKQLVAASHQMRFFYKDESLITEQQLFVPNTTSDFFTNQYYFSISSKQYSVILKDLQTELEQLIQKRTHPEALKKICTSVLFSVFLTLQTTYPNKAEVFTNEQINIINTISGIHYESDFLPVITQIIQQLTDKIEKLSEDSNQAILIEKMLTYINNHYNEKITLNSLADKFHFSPGYLSRFFSTNFDETFSSYLNRVRIQHSCALLKHETLSISEVAEQCGYSDIFYFSKVFKKYTGKTPSQVKKGSL